MTLFTAPLSFFSYFVITESLLDNQVNWSLTSYFADLSGAKINFQSKWLDKVLPWLSPTPARPTPRESSASMLMRASWSGRRFVTWWKKRRSSGWSWLVLSHSGKEHCGFRDPYADSNLLSPQASQKTIYFHLWIAFSVSLLTHFTID